MLAYHRVLDMGVESEFPADPELVSATTRDFAEQMEFVRRHFTLLRFEQVIEAMNTRTPLPQRSMLVTFDDGHIDNYTEAFPVLRKLGVPATIFISTDYIGTSQMFWFDRMAFLMYCAEPGTYRLATVDHGFVLTDVASRRRASGDLVRVLKRVANETRLQALAELESTLKPLAGMPVAPQRAAMNWDEVREMSHAGVDFASHSVTHPVLTRLDDTALERELRESRSAIRAETGRDLPVVAYPVGKEDAFDDRVVAAARRCGYELGVSYVSGTNPRQGFAPFALRRLAVERYTSMSMFKSMLALPQVFR